MKLCLSVLWLALVSSALGQDMAHDNPSPYPSSHMEVQFKLYRNYLIVVQGSLGLLDGLNFLIDTGSNPTAVDKRLAKKLALKGQSRKLDLLDQSDLVEATVLPTLRLGPIRAESLPGIIQDLSEVEKNLGVRIDAIVGFGILSAESFTIDYDAMKIVFGEIEPLPFAVPFDTAPPTVTVTLQFGDQLLRLLLDTGAKDLLLFKCSLPGPLHELVTLSAKHSSSSKGVAFAVQEARFSQVHLGSADLGAITALVVPGKQTCGWTFAGVMGMSALGFRQIAFDFTRRSFSFRK